MTGRRRTYAERRAQTDARRAARAEIQDPGIVLEAAASFLSVRPRSIDETRRRLRQLGYAPEPIETVLDRLVEFGYLDDEAFARAWVESRDRARPRGGSVLRRELTLKGVDREIIATVLAARDEDPGANLVADGPEHDDTRGSTDVQLGRADAVAARRLLARRAATLGREGDPRKRRHRAYALLARNGFAPDICARVSLEVVGGGGDDEADEAGPDDV